MTLTMNDTEKKVRKYLGDIGIKEGLAGYTYLLDIILYQLEHPSPLLRDALISVADRYGITSRNVQNSIQYSLKDLKQVGCGKECKQIVIDCINYIRSEEV